MLLSPFLFPRCNEKAEVNMAVIYKARWACWGCETQNIACWICPPNSDTVGRIMGTVTTVSYKFPITERWHFTVKQTSRKWIPCFTLRGVSQPLSKPSAPRHRRDCGNKCAVWKQAPRWMCICWTQNNTILYYSDLHSLSFCFIYFIMYYLILSHVIIMYQIAYNINISDTYWTFILHSYIDYHTSIK